MESGEVVGQESETLLSFEPRIDPTGIEIIDHIERRRCSLYTPTSVSPSNAPVDAFYFPVDRGVSVTTDRLTLPHTVAACLRNHAGFMVDELTQGESRTFPSDLYSIELSAPVKLYIVVEAAPSVSVTTEEVTISFERPVEVSIGARSHHKHPAATIVTTDDPRDMMEAVSYLGSALKTTSVERSYPTLRGHPPTIELGESNRIPGMLRKPETGVTLELPPDYESIFVGSSLAYYLGADMRPAANPRLVTDTGFVHELDDPGRGFEGEVERVLKQVFFLDCVTRTEGFYPVNLHERNQIEDKVSLDFEALYDQPIERQLEQYLEVPYSMVEPQIPQWVLTAHITTIPENIEFIPYIINDLAICKSVKHQDIDQNNITSTTIDNFTRKSSFTRSTRDRASTDAPPQPSLVDVDNSDALEETWIGEGIAMGISKALKDAYVNRLNRNPSKSDIGITVVCNDKAMENERDIVNQIYGTREELPFEVNVNRRLTCNELENILKSDIDFFHYIGHVDESGFECVDGYFDASNIERTGIDIFFLNACSSYYQGKSLIRAGSIAGVVTHQEVINSGAERIGESLAMLLNRGFPIQPALDIAKNQSIMGGHYLVVGDPGINITQTESGIAVMCDLKSQNEKYKLEYNTFPTQQKSIGSLTIPFITKNNEYYLSSGITGNFSLEKSELNDFLKKENMPILYKNSLEWSESFELD